MDWTPIKSTWTAPSEVCVQIKGVAYRSKDGSRMPQEKDVVLDKDEIITGIDFYIWVK
jgi:hypothetical protein